MVTHGSNMQNILLLGGTSEASQLAQQLAAHPVAGRQAVFSYAGRTARPATQPLRQRLGGFGGAAGLVDYIRREGVTHVIDATHPFAAQMSRNAVAACAEVGASLCALQRPAWQAGVADNWTHVPSLAAAADVLPDEPARVFLAIGKQNLDLFTAAPQHHYLLRLVDEPEGDLPLAQTMVVIARGPFQAAEDQALMRQHGVTHIVSKNAGGIGAEAKLIAARRLSLPVIMVDRPTVPARTVFGTVDEVMCWLGHSA
jgi:precorrin-6A/cobalt-precorrin-6A reductase